MAERLRHWRTISEAQVQFPGRVVVRRNDAPVPYAALNGCELHVKPDFNF